MYKIHRIFFGYESKQMPNALTPSEAALSKNPGLDPTLNFICNVQIIIFKFENWHRFAMQDPTNKHT